MTRTLVVYCNPNPASFGAAVLERALAGLQRAGHDVRLTDLYADGFEPTLSAEERRRHLDPGVAADVQPYADDLRWAEAIVLVYPTWWSGQPAMLKGWIDRIWASGIAWHLPEGSATLRPLLGDIRRLVVVTTHGSSKFVNALEGEAGKRTVSRALRALCGRRARTTWCAMYGLDTAGEEHRRAFLDRVERTLARL